MTWPVVASSGQFTWLDVVPETLTLFSHMGILFPQESLSSALSHGHKSQTFKLGQVFYESKREWLSDYGRVMTSQTLNKSQNILQQQLCWVHV